MAIYITNVSVIGVSKESSTFGEHQRRYRSVKKVELEGFLDDRTNYAGTSGIIDGIESTVQAQWGLTSNAQPMDDIFINGTGIGKGKITSASFDAGPDALSNQIRLGSYQFSIEFYESGNIGATLENATIPDMEFLEEFSESFSVSLGEGQEYSLTHDINVTYMSGLKADGTAVNPIASSKTLATNLYSQTPTQFSTALGNYYGLISSAAKRRTNETYDAIKGTATFQRRFSLGPEDGTTYSVGINHNFTIDEMGFCTVKEEGEIKPRTGNLNTTTRNAIGTELGSSYSRCNTVYTAYKSDLSTVSANNRTLNSQPVDRERSIDLNNGGGSYSITYTDNANRLNNAIVDRTITLESPVWDGQITIKENGTVTQNNPVGLWDNIWTLIPSRATVKSRCQNVYNKYIVNAGSPYMTLKNLKNNFGIPNAGKAVTYTYTFTDDPSIFDSGPFSRRSISETDDIGAPTQTKATVPNISYQVLQTPGFTQLGRRSVKFEGQLRRYNANPYTNSILNIYNPNSSMSAARILCMEAGYRVFADNQFIYTRDMGQLFCNSAAYTYDSSHKFTMDLSFTYPLVRVNSIENLMFQ